jgi:Flp pilus assembly protein TadB
VSKERQQRRAEREAAAAKLAEQRAAEAEKQARRDARKASLTGWLPRPAARQTGLLAEKRRRQAGATFAGLVAFNLLVYAFTEDWYLTALTIVASLLGAPIVHMMLFRRN